MRFKDKFNVEIQEDVEICLFDYINEDYIRIPEIPLYRIDINGKRHYVREEENKKEIFPSVTTILHEVTPMNYGLLNWHVQHGWEKVKEILDITSAYGTEMHKIFTELILGGWINFQALTENQKQDVIGFIQWVKDYNVRPLAIEYVVHGDGYAGAVDLVCKMQYKGKEIIAMVDYKTGRNGFYDDHILQLHAYRQLWDELNPDVKIDRLFNYGCKDYRIPIGKTVVPYRFTDQTDVKNATENWNLYLQIYKNNHEKVNTQKYVYAEIEDVSIETDVSTLYEEIDLLNKIKEVENEQN